LGRGGLLVCTSNVAFSISPLASVARFEKFAFNYVPEDVETFFREALVCYSHNQFHAFASMVRRTAAVTLVGNAASVSWPHCGQRHR
jgi:hypothetical protein